jgi:hypothetical protein
VNNANEPMKNLFIATAAIEAGVGVLLIAAPSFVSRLLLGSSLEGPVAVAVGRMTGIALLCLGVACWMARSDHSPAAKGVVSAMLLYNVAVALLLTYAGIGLRLFGIGLWPAVLLHVGMTVWCVRSRAASNKRPPALN